MIKKLLPAAGIIIVTVILIAINEYTSGSFIKDYALILIVAGMLLGVGLGRWSDRTTKEKTA